jgi:DNA processing protein
VKRADVLGVGVAGPIGVDSRSEHRVTARPGWEALSEREAWGVITSVSGIGPVGFAMLLGHFGTGREILAAATRPRAVRRLVAAGIHEERETFGRVVAEELVQAAGDPSGVLAAIRDAGVEILTLDDEAYPARLRAIEMPPHVLFVRGSVAALSSGVAVAVVGTRRPTEHGRLLAARIGAAIARQGGSVVSGLAVGVDGAAQAAVTAEHGTTVAVLGSGHGRLYPRAHARLAESIVANGGAVVSELAPDVAPTAGTFPRRNRLISGLSDATIVVEAASKSGALITAGWALEQGRDCFMVPGPIDAPQSAGCLEWLRLYPADVRIVAGIPELIEDLGLVGAGRQVTAAGEARERPRRVALEAELVELGTTARRIALELLRGRATLDELVLASGQPVATTLGALTLLEVRGLATSAYGRYRPAGRLASADPRTVPAA